jgi:hypothetical protein
MELVLIKSETFYEDMTLSLVLFIYFFVLSNVIRVSYDGLNGRLAE